jgi:hypothetical protein
MNCVQKVKKWSVTRRTVLGAHVHRGKVSGEVTQRHEKEAIRVQAQFMKRVQRLSHGSGRTLVIKGPACRGKHAGELTRTEE